MISFSKAVQMPLHAPPKKASSHIHALHLRNSICQCNVAFHIFLAHQKVSLKTMSKARERSSPAGRESAHVWQLFSPSCQMSPEWAPFPQVLHPEYSRRSARRHGGVGAGLTQRQQSQPQPPAVELMGNLPAGHLPPCSGQ